MEFKLEISRTGTTFYELDLFENQQLDYDVDFYDSLALDKIKLPFYTNLRIPYTQTNKSSNLFNYDVVADTASNFPRDDFFFRLTIFGTVDSVITGILNVKSIEYNSDEPYVEVELKDHISKYFSQIKEVPLGEIYNDTAHTTRYTLINMFNNLAGISGGQKGIIGTQPDTNLPIIFPYVDLNNDIDKFGYPQRNFLEYGTGIKRTGLVPAFSVSKFLEYLGAYLDSVDFPVRIDSKLFGVGDFSGSPAIPDMEVEKLYFITSAWMLAKQDTNTRNFFLRQAAAWVGENTSLESVDSYGGVVKDFTTGWWGNMEISGNAGGVSSTERTYLSWGANKRMTSYPNSTNESVRGYFAPKVSFNADIELNSGNTSATITGFEVELPVAQDDKMIVNLDVANSTMKFTPYIGVYEDGMMVKKIELTDVNGDRILMTPTGKKEAYSKKTAAASPYDYYKDGDGVVYSTSSTAWDTFTFDPVTVYFPQDETIFINGGSRYSTNYFLEPDDGYVRTNHVTAFTSSGNPRTATGVTTDVDFYSPELKKIITRIPTFSEYTKLNIKFTANEDFLPHNITDEIVIKDSILSTCEDSLSDVLLRIAKRFNCGLFYDYDDVTGENILRVDPLHLVRSGTQDISEYIDDRRSFKIKGGGDSLRSIEILNKGNDLFYDEEIKGVAQTVNSNGIREISTELDSSVFYKSLCGEESFDAAANFNLQAGAFSEAELGFSKNYFTPNDSFGFRFAYVKAPSYATWLLTPHIVMDTQDLQGSMKTEIERLYSKSAFVTGQLNNLQTVFNGELTHQNASGWDLRTVDELGNTTDYYDLYTSSELIKTTENATVEFDMVVPTSDIADLEFFFKTFTAPDVSSSSIYVKSAKGVVYEDYAYLTVEGLLI